MRKQLRDWRQQGTPGPNRHNKFTSHRQHPPVPTQRETVGLTSFEKKGVVNDGVMTEDLGATVHADRMRWEGSGRGGGGGNMVTVDVHTEAHAWEAEDRGLELGVRAGMATQDARGKTRPSPEGRGR